MLIVLLDEPCLHVFSSVAEAEGDIEAIDAESEIRAAFDDTAIPYCVKWIRPNRRRKALLGLLEISEQGEYRLVPAGPANPDALIDLIEKYPDNPDPPEAKVALSAIAEKLRSETP